MEYSKTLPSMFDSWTAFHDDLVWSGFADRDEFMWVDRPKSNIQTFTDRNPLGPLGQVTHADRNPLGQVTQEVRYYQVRYIEQKALAELKEKVKQETFTENELRTLYHFVESSQHLVGAIAPEWVVNKMINKIDLLIVEARNREFLSR